MWKRDGKRTAMGLGGYPATTLARARKLAADARRVIAEGGNPLVEARKEREPTFAECVGMFLADNGSAWRSSRHRTYWETTLGDGYCRYIRPMPVSSITTEDVLRVLQPLWKTTPETASRLRGRIERVLSFAKVKGWRSGENPAMWRGHLAALLPKRQKLTRGHFAAMQHAELPAFMQRLRHSHLLGAPALEFAILTAARSGEVGGATWDEVNFEQRVWVIPATRMKAGLEHRVPLSPSALAVLERQREIRQNVYVFPGERRDRPVTGVAIRNALASCAAGSVTVHGFRSSFRDWAGDSTSFPREVAEAALADAVGDAVERAYRRSDALEKRRQLMEMWASYLDGGEALGIVVPLRG